MDAEERVAGILADWSDRLGRGESADPDDVIRAHPDLGDALREAFGALELVDLALGTAPGGEPPLPDAIGPYRIEALLGAGGMGTVYRAVSSGAGTPVGAGRPVAVKVVHPHLLRTPGFFKRFLREADLGRRVTHPNVVQTLDVDALELDGRAVHFLVMEYVEGQTLLELGLEHERVPEELCRHVAREVACGLAAIHRAGAVHRDLKPENVLITQDHVVKVMDLGVARLADEQMRLSRTGVFVGSLLYAAPEQIEGRETDGRCDLYALGLVLYELATGQHPFRTDEPAAVLQRQRESEPARAGEVNPQLSPFFEELVHTLLAKDRDARIASAADLVRILEAGEEGAWWRSRELEIRQSTQRPLRRILLPRETALYGREGEVAALRERFERARRGEGQVVLVEGEAGIGKTRLVDEVVATLRREGASFEFLHGSHPPGGGGSAVGALSGALAEHLGRDGLPEALARRLPDAATWVPAFAALLGGAPPPAGASPLGRDALHTAFVHTLRALAAERPLVLLVDDLHFAPEESLALFSALAVDVRDHPILLVGTMRPGLPAAWKAGLTRREGATLLELGRLGPKDVGRLLEDAFHSPRLAEELGYRILTKSDGNPFFVFEIIRGMREGNLLRQRPDGTWVTTRVIEELEVPSSVVDLVRARVSDLTREERNLLDVAACAGHDFDPLVVGSVLGLEPIPALQDLAYLESQHRLLRSAGKRMVFDHHQVQETLYEALPALLREEYHAALGDALERRGGRHDETPGSSSVEICDHFLRAGRGPRAVGHLLPAIAHLERNHLHGRVAALCDRALSLDGLEGAAQRLPVLLHAIEANESTGRMERMAALLEEAHALASAAGDPRLLLRVDAQRANHLHRAGRLEEARRLCRDVAKRAAELDEVAIRQRVTSLLGVLCSMGGRPVEAERVLEEARTLARELGDDAALAGASSNLGLVLMAHSDLARAEPILCEAIETARRAGVRRFECIATGNLGGVFLDQGRQAEARETILRHRALSREIGYRRGEMIALANLASLCVNAGRLDEAREYEEQHLPICRELGDAVSEVESLGRLAQISLDEGDLGAALETAQEQVRRARETEGSDLVPRALRMQGDVLSALGALEEAETSYRDALASTEAVVNAQVRIRALQGLAHVHAVRGDAAKARRRLEEALALAERCGASASEIALRLELCEHDLDGAVPATDAGPIRSLLRRALDGGSQGLAVAAVILLARTTGDEGDVREAARRLQGAELPPYVRMRELLAFHRLRGDAGALEEAKRLLDGVVARAPRDRRTSLLENVPLHRAIVETWATHADC